MRTAATEYPNVRRYLNSDYAEFSDQKIESLLQSRNVDAEAMEGWLSDLGNFAKDAGKAIVKAAPAVLPIAGTVVGGAFGGPLGASLGGKLGSLAGGAIGSAAGQGGGGAPAGLGLPMGLGSPAAGQLLQTFLRPQTMQALTSMALGPLGKPNVGVNGIPVPVNAFANLLGVLAGRAEAEYNAMAPATSGASPKYLQDFAGEAKGDPAVAESRADALAELLQFSQSEQENYARRNGRKAAGAYEAADAYEFAEYEASEVEAIHAQYDALERLEMQFEMETEER